MSSTSGAPQPSPEYLAEDKRNGPRIGIAIIISIVYVVLALRFYARYISRSAGPDDYLMGVAAVVSVATIAMCIHVINLGAGRHMEALSPPELARLYKSLVGLQLIYHINLWVCRISGIAFYSRLCKNAGRSSMYMWMAFAFVTAVALAQFLILGLQCIPLKALWRDGPGQCLTQYAVFISTASMTIICDSLVLLIPLRIIWGLKMNPKRKLVLGFVLLIGAFAVITSVVRITKMIPAVTKKDNTWYLSTVIFWSVIEMGSAIIALSTPALKPLFGKWMSDDTPQGSRGYKGFDNAQTPGRRMSSYQMESFGSAKQASKAGATLSESAETPSEENLCNDPTACEGIRKTVEYQVTR
ncbi:MAG: hypothetical protein M1816_002696 [Peltula sp. TS41687]|nr:MAG: hypothetical protein M1816_002696 [Peltula sp. TS41687]